MWGQGAHPGPSDLAPPFSTHGTLPPYLISTTSRRFCLLESLSSLSTCRPQCKPTFLINICHSLIFLLPITQLPYHHQRVSTCPLLGKSFQWLPGAFSLTYKAIYV